MPGMAPTYSRLSWKMQHCDSLKVRFSPKSAAQNHVWKYVDAGDATTYAIRDDGTLWSCGWNEKGQLGVPGVAERTAEWQMVGQDADRKKAVGGKAYAFFIEADGSLWAVGTQENGVQGTGDGVDHRQPVRVGTDSDWADVAASRFWGYSAIGLKTDGSIWGWGSNSSSQLGLDGAGARVTPERIGTDNDWKMVTMGVSHTMAIKADGSLWGWGQNYNGQLGTGDTESRPKPVRIGADNDWAYVKAIDNRTYMPSRPTARCGPRATTTQTCSAWHSPAASMSRHTACSPASLRLTGRWPRCRGASRQQHSPLARAGQ